MRAMVLSLVVLAGMTGVATAHDCSGQGSDRVLTFDDWTISTGGKSRVDLRYRLSGEETATRLQAHVYFQIDPDDVLADGAIDLENATGVPSSGTASLSLAKDAALWLASADPARVHVFACTNYIEYLGGKSLIID